MDATPTCQTCLRIHGRDTTAPIRCPVCRAIVGCFWHNRAFRHVQDCKRKEAGLPPVPRLEDILGGEDDART